MTTWFVSRHPGAIAWAGKQGLCVDQYATHLDPSLVQPGDTVIGTLPIHLAAQVCNKEAQFLNLSFDMQAFSRGRELSAEELHACNARLECFQITSQAAWRTSR